KQHDIEVTRLAESITAQGRTFRKEDSFYVPMAQTNNRMIRGIFERFTEFEENVFYDVSGWTLPLAYDLEYARVSSASSAGAADGAFQSAPAPRRSTYGYVFDWSYTYAPKALNRILAKGIMARAAMEEGLVSTTAGDVFFGRGSVFVPLARQEASPEEIHLIMETIAREDGVPVYAATSGLTPTTGQDLGASRIFRSLEEPKVVLAYEGGLARYDVGEVWWTLDYRHRIPVTLVKKRDLGSLDWSEYTHLVLVGGNADLDEDMTKELKTWIEHGGTLIATRDAALWAQGSILDREEDEENEEGSEASAQDEAPIERLDFADMGVRDAEDVIGGAIFATDLDISHPLGFGYSDRDLPVHRNVSFTLMRPEENPYAVPVQYTANPLLTGYASQRRLEEIGGSPSVIAERMKQGAVILMADNPVFRGTFAGSEKLLTNAIFFSDLIDQPRGDYERED
ncbi:MAG: peptidase, partial [Pseudomonadota bacterium]